jgi:hypothetical protein
MRLHRDGFPDKRSETHHLLTEGDSKTGARDRGQAVAYAYDNQLTREVDGATEGPRGGARRSS